MKNIIRPLAILLIVFTFIPSLVYAEIITEITDTHKFSDISSSDVEVLYLHQIGIIKGASSGIVASEDPLNRAETLTLLSRFFNLEPAYDSNCTFSDIPSTAWYAGYVSAMCNQGLVTGYPDGTFRPSTQLNRSEALALVVRGIGKVPSVPFNNLSTDVNSSDWYAPYAEFAAAHNLFSGVNAEFNGAKSYTRGDMFEILYRYARITELGVDTYTRNLDPQIVSVVENKNANVTFKVTSDSNIPSYFNNLPELSLDETGVTLPLTYEEAAYDLIRYWLVAFNGDADADFLAKTVGPLRRIKFMDNVDFTNEVTDFYEYFGVDMTGKAVNAELTNTELTNVISNIKNKADEYERMVDNLKVSFLVKDQNTISIIFNDVAMNGSIDFSLRIDRLKEKNTGVEVPISKTIIDSNHTWGVDSNGNQIIESPYSFIDIDLETNLEDGKTYVLELEPLIFRRDVRGSQNLGRYWGSSLYYTNLYLPASEFEFINNSAKEFNYVGEGNQNLSGIAIKSDIRTSLSNFPLSALAYSEDGRILDIESGELNWSVIDGAGHISTGSNGSPRLVFDAIESSIDVRVEYKGFEDTLTIYHVPGPGI